jgi:hypothetical protein
MRVKPRQTRNVRMIAKLRMPGDHRVRHVAHELPVLVRVDVTRNPVGEVDPFQDSVRSLEVRVLPFKVWVVLEGACGAGHREDEGEPVSKSLAEKEKGKKQTDLEADDQTPRTR